MDQLLGTPHVLVILMISARCHPPDLRPEIWTIPMRPWILTPIGGGNAKDLRVGIPTSDLREDLQRRDH